MASRNRRYKLDMSACTERFLGCSPHVSRSGEQMTTRDGLPISEVTTLEDVDWGEYATTDDKQQVLLVGQPVSFPKYARVRFVNPVLRQFSFRNERGETISGITIYVDDVVAADESGDVDE